MSFKNQNIVSPQYDLKLMLNILNLFFMFVYENYLHICFFLLQKRSQDAAGGHYLAK